MKTSLALLFPVVLVLGCRVAAPGPGTDVSAAETVHFDPASVRVLQPVSGQRFTSTSSILVSYDTQTGQVCKTYGWEATESKTGITSCAWLADQPPPKRQP